MKKFEQFINEKTESWSVRIKAVFEFKLSQEGRRGPILDGYRPSFYIDDINKNTDCVFKLLDRDRIIPGDECEVILNLLHPHLLGDKFKVGAVFTISEGRRNIGIGKILEIL